MDVKIVNKIPGIRVTVDKNADGGFTVRIDDDTRVKLGEKEPGSVIKIGDKEFIILYHEDGGTAVLAKDSVTAMRFGDSGDYRDSDVRKWLNTVFCEELRSVIGAENIKPHSVCLIADDGTQKGVSCEDYVSLLTTEQYREFREIINDIDEWWWLATRVSGKVYDYNRNVCGVRYDGVLDWGICVDSDGVRPFCILDSCLLV